MENARDNDNTDPEEKLSGIYDIFRENVEENRSYPLVIFHGKHVSHYNILTMADSLAESLRTDLSVEKGDMVGIALPLSPQFFTVFIGLQKIGAVAVPLDPDMTNHELGNIMATVKLKSIFLKETTGLDIKKDTGLESVVLTRIQDFLPFEKAVSQTIRGAGKAVKPSDFQVATFRFTDMIYGRRGEPATIDPENDPAVAIISPSRIGRLQAMIFTHAGIIRSASALSTSLPPIKGRFRIATTLPPFVPSAMELSVILPVYLGGTAITVLERSNYYKLFSLCSLFDCDFMLSSPYDLTQLLDEGLPNLAIKSLKGILCSSYLLTAYARDNVSKTYGTHIIEFYGIPEMGGITHIQSTDRTREKPGSPGRPLPGTEAVVLEEKTHESVPRGVTGELYMKGPGMAQRFLPPLTDSEGYYHEGFFDSGDIANMDENGLFHIEERRREALISRGILVSSREIEEVISSVEGVTETAIIGLDNQRGEETIVAIVAAENESNQLSSRIMKACQANLSYYKVPKKIEFRKELPKSMSGKVLKSQLIEGQAAPQ